MEKSMAEWATMELGEAFTLNMVMLAPIVARNTLCNNLYF